MRLPKGVLVHNCASLTVEPVKEGAACACGAGQLCCCLCAAGCCACLWALGMAQDMCLVPQPVCSAQQIVRGHKRGGTSACSFPDHALSSHIFCPQHQMAGQSLFKIVTTCLEAGLIHSAASLLGIFPASYSHFRLSRSLCL